MGRGYYRLQESPEKEGECLRSASREARGGLEGNGGYSEEWMTLTEDCLIDLVSRRQFRWHGEFQVLPFTWISF